MFYTTGSVYVSVSKKLLGDPSAAQFAADDVGKRFTSLLNKPPDKSNFSHPGTKESLDFEERAYWITNDDQRWYFSETQRLLRVDIHVDLDRLDDEAYVVERTSFGRTLAFDLVNGINE